METNLKLNYIIAGERRSGTTFLHNLLFQQENIAINKKADFDYFIDDEVKTGTTYKKIKESDERWHRDHSREDFLSQLEFTNNSSIKGLKNADFFYWANAHRKAKTWFPDLKIILVLRNPIKRAFSHYANEVIKGREPLSFEEAIAMEEQRFSESDYARLHLSYVDRGFYHKSLERLLETFNSSKVLIILDFELYINPQSQVDRIAQFLGFKASEVRIAQHAKNQNFKLEKRNSGIVNALSPLVPGYIRVMNFFITRMTNERNRRNELRAKWYMPFYRKKEFKIGKEAERILYQRYADSIRQLEATLNRKTGWI